MKTQNSAGLIIYRQTPEGPKFLLLYHGHNYWNFPKGKLEGQERAIQAALREVREETGLKNSEIKLQKNFKTKERFTFRDRLNKDQIFKIVTFYLAETTQPQIKIVDREHQGYGWFLYPEAKRILGRYKNTRDIITKAYNLIKGRGPESSPRPESSPAPTPTPASPPRRHWRPRRPYRPSSPSNSKAPHAKS